MYYTHNKLVVMVVASIADREEARHWLTKSHISSITAKDVVRPPAVYHATYGGACLHGVRTKELIVIGINTDPRLHPEIMFRLVPILQPMQSANIYVVDSAKPNKCPCCGATGFELRNFLLECEFCLGEA